MIRIASLFAAGLLLAPPVQAQYGAHGGFGPQPSMCLARVDDKGIVQIRLVTGQRVPLKEMVIKKTNDKGEEIDVKVTVGRQTINEEITTLPAGVVKLFDTDGKLQDAAGLAGLLRTEKPVLVVAGPPEAKYLASFRKDLPVLSLPGPNIPGPERAPNIIGN